MEKINIIKPKEDRSIKTEAIVFKLLQHYNIDAVEVEKFGSEYIIYTKEDTLCLRKCKHTRREVKNISILTKELIKLGFNSIPRYISTSEGNLYVQNKNGVFYLSEWIEGERCNLSDMRDAVKCVELLAKLHNIVKGSSFRNLKIKEEPENVYQKFNNCITKLERYKNIIETKRIKNEFDSLYYSSLEYEANIGLLSLNLLNKYNYFKLFHCSNSDKNVSFKQFTAHNIVRRNNTYFILNIGNIYRDMQTNDLARIIHKINKKDDYCWNFEKVKLFIDKYIAINTLSKDEIGILLAMLIFPYKYYKLGKERYLKHKSYSESVYLDKLQKVTKNTRQKELFINEYLNYLNRFEDSI